jgi:uncharacterized membrane protein YgdD (TMEM256/DUF423 family)
MYVVTGTNMNESKMQSDNNSHMKLAKRWLVTGALLCLFSVIIGAFAAHSLKAVLNEYQLDIVQTGAKYQMYHGLAMLICSIVWVISGQMDSYYKIANIAFLSGSLLFSGSLYLLVMSEIKIFAFLTPLGGLCFIVGWSFFIWALIKNTPYTKRKQ